MSEAYEPAENAESAAPLAERRFSRRGLLLLACGLLLIFVVAPILLLGPYVHYRLTQKSPMPVAMYQGFSLRQDPEFYELVTDLEADQVQPIFVELPDTKKFSLPELPESAVGALLAKVPPRDPPSDANEYTDSRSFLTFRDGKLVFAVLHARSQKFRVAGSEAGPFAALPLTRDQMVATFGNPVRWERRAQAPSDDGGTPGL